MNLKKIKTFHLLLAVLCLVVVLSAAGAILFVAPPPSQETIDAVKTRFVLRDVEHGLLMYQRQFERHPDESTWLDELRASEGDVADLGVDAWGRIVEVDFKEWEIRSAGLDGVMGNEDDVTLAITQLQAP
ncbi:MAG: hypothetical protein RIG82_02895 [Phycisphaeraceae bacterium]